MLSLTKQFVKEDAMKKRQWHVQRQFIEVPDAQQRWDRAYQFLLSWTPSMTPARQAPATDNAGEKGLDHHEDCSLRSGFYPTAGSNANH